MSIILFKLITLIVRTIARPLIVWVSYYKKMKLQQSNSSVHMFIRHRLIWTGQNINYYNTIINRKLFKIQSTSAVTSLSEDKALEKGAETLSEFLVYSILIVVPIFEWFRLSKISKKKELKKEKKIKEMRYELDEMLKESDGLNKELIEIKNILINVSEKLEKSKLI